jgi:antitoxin component of RelBE/YafQ-DinJ toxin-antitoxin module
MNTAALTIRTTPDTKKMITRFAASVGLSTSAFATAILTQAVRDQKVILTPVLEPTPYLSKILKQADKDIKAGRNLSKSHTSVDDMFDEMLSED